MSYTSHDVMRTIKSKSDPVRAQHAQRFFKTGKGEYAEGDVFLGLSMPDHRKLVQRFNRLPIDEIPALLTQDIHEYRMVGLLLVPKTMGTYI